MTGIDTEKFTEVARLLVEYEKFPTKVDGFLEAKFSLYFKYRQERQICQFIFLTVLRNKLLIEHVLKTLLLRKTRPLLKSILMCGCAEIIAGDSAKRPQIIHAWVDVAKSALSLVESKVANAVLRRFAERYDEMKASASGVADYALLYSHPQWLAESWVASFGEERARAIMQGNQRPADVFFRVAPSRAANIAFAPFMENFEKTEYSGFYKMKGGKWNEVSPLLDTPYVYIQDPATGVGPRALHPRPDEKILDLCASPGGKSRMIADLLLAEARDLSNTLLVSVDLGGARFERLKENLSKIDFMPVRSLACDLLKDDFEKALENAKLPTLYDAIYLDAPCSNTGVLRRRPDARLRLKKSDVAACAEIQKKMIKIALARLAPNGRLLYSTCSIEPEENELAPKAAIAETKGFKIEKCETVLPAEHDGAGLCLITRAD